MARRPILLPIGTPNNGISAIDARPDSWEVARQKIEENFQEIYAGDASPGASLFSKAVAVARAGGTPARILVHGHSHVSGEGAGSSTLALTGCAALGYAARLPAYLTALGIPAERHGFFGDYNAGVGSVTAPVLDSRLVFGSGWGPDAGNCLGGKMIIQATGQSGFMEFTPGYVFTSCRIGYPISPALTASLGVYIDDVLTATINEAGSTALGRLDLSIPAGARKLSFKNNGAGTGYLLNGQCFRPGQVAVVAVAGMMNGKAADLADVAQLWAPLNGLIDFAPHLHILHIVTNDLNAPTVVGTFQTSIEAIFAKSTLTAASFVVIDSPGSGAHFTDGTYETYADAIRTSAGKYGARVIDLRNVFSRSWAAANTAALMFDANHPNAAGHDLIAQYLAKEILRAG